jgi:hypothetical protein
MDTVEIIRIVAGLVFILVILPVIILPYWKIFQKAGFTPALSILMLVPLVNLILLYYVAFSDWKPASGNITPI